MNLFMDNRFIILVGSYNNAQWVESNINSIVVQDYSNYKVVYFDDASTDGTDDAVAKKVKNNPRFTIAKVQERQYKTWFFSNLEKFTTISDNDIVVFLDGDDMFYCENVLSYINEIYKKTNCWMTYGGMVVWKGGDEIVEPYPQNSEIPREVKDKKAYRQDIWRTSHLKTMRGFVWKQIDKSDLMPNGKAMVGPDDLAIMFSALEMCPPQKVYRVTDPLYLYNHTPQNQGSRAFTDAKKSCIDYESIVRNRKPYDTISIVSPTFAGGLGNQMFEVAAAASLAKDHNALLMINPNEHILPNQGRNINNYISNIFGKIAIDCAPPLQILYSREHMAFEPIPFQPNVKLRGHFQSFKYFDHNRDYIRNLFAPSKFLMDQLKEKYSEASKVTAIQVRRGDYIKFPNHHPLLPTDYYKNLTNFLTPYKIWIFSDDIQWCKENLHFDCPVEYIKEEDYIEMYLISHCKNIVISNSSFGWWAGYLKTNPGQIFAPYPWFGPYLLAEGFKHDDLIPSDWIVIKT